MRNLVRVLALQMRRPSVTKLPWRKLSFSEIEYYFGHISYSELNCLSEAPVRLLMSFVPEMTKQVSTQRIHFFHEIVSCTTKG